MSKKRIRCIECQATSKHIWKLDVKEADFGNTYGIIRWTRYQCRKCGRVWVDREQIKEDKTEKSG